MSGNELVILSLIAVIGACCGSFITAASWRLPRDENVVSGHSKCPKCGHKLGVFDLIPIFSWLFSRGKCRYCKTSVSIRYALTELLTTLVFVGLYFKFGLTAEFIILSLLSVALLILIISDFETYIIPDSTTIGAFILAIAWHYQVGSDWSGYIYGFIAGLSIALALKYGFIWIMKKDALGFGDVKFLPVAGLWIGLEAMPVYFIMSGIIGILTGIFWRIFFKNPEYPFGPALAVAMLLLVVFPEINLLTLQPK